MQQRVVYQIKMVNWTTFTWIVSTQKIVTEQSLIGYKLHCGLISFGSIAGVYGPSVSPTFTFKMHKIR